MDEWGRLETGLRRNFCPFDRKMLGCVFRQILAGKDLFPGKNYFLLVCGKGVKVNKSFTCFNKQQSAVFIAILNCYSFTRKRSAWSAMPGNSDYLIIQLFYYTQPGTRRVVIIACAIPSPRDELGVAVLFIELVICLRLPLARNPKPPQVQFFRKINLCTRLRNSRIDV